MPKLKNAFENYLFHSYNNSSFIEGDILFVDEIEIMQFIIN